MQDISKLTSKNRVASSRDREIGCFSCATYSSECGACILYTIIVTLERKWPGCTFEGCGLLRGFTSTQGKHIKVDTRWSSYIYTMFSFNLETRVMEILATKLSSVYSTHLSLSLSLLSENYNDALLFYTCERFFHDKETTIECNFTWKNKEEIRSTD